MTSWSAEPANRFTWVITYTDERPATVIRVSGRGRLENEVLAHPDRISRHGSFEIRVPRVNSTAPASVIISWLPEGGSVELREQIKF